MVWVEVGGVGGVGVEGVVGNRKLGRVGCVGSMGGGRGGWFRRGVAGLMVAGLMYGADTGRNVKGLICVI